MKNMKYGLCKTAHKMKINVQWSNTACFAKIMKNSLHGVIL